MNTVIKKVGLAVDQAVVTGTPIDTGTARSNWLASLVTPRSDVIGSYAPGNPGGVTNAALSQAAGVIGLRKTGQDIVISNNVPYIGKLNAGSSQQAPAGFVESAVQEGAAVVRSARVVTQVI